MKLTVIALIATASSFLVSGVSGRDLKGKGSKAKNRRNDRCNAEIQGGINQMYEGQDLDRLKQGYKGYKKSLKLVRADPDKYLTEDVKAAFTYDGVYYPPEHPVYDTLLAGFKAASEGPEAYGEWASEQVAIAEENLSSGRRDLQRSPRRRRNIGFGLSFGALGGFFLGAAVCTLVTGGVGVAACLIGGAAIAIVGTSGAIVNATN